MSLTKIVADDTTKHDVYRQKTGKIEADLRKVYKGMGLKWSDAIDQYRKKGRQWPDTFQDKKQKDAAKKFAELVDAHDKLVPPMATLEKRLNIASNKLGRANKTFKDYIEKKKKSKNPITMFKNKKAIPKSEALLKSAEETHDALLSFVENAGDNKYVEEAIDSKPFKPAKVLQQNLVGKSAKDLQRELDAEED